MQPKYGILHAPDQEEISTAQELAPLLETFLAPLVLVLDRVVDKRLGRHARAVVCRHHSLQEPEARTVVKRIRVLVFAAMPDSPRRQPQAASGWAIGSRSLKWSVSHSDRFLLEEANKEVERLKAEGKRILCLFDGSVIEKPESRTRDSTGPVLSSKAKRLTRSRKGLLFNQPALGPLRGRGMEWTGTIITGLEGIPKLAVMRWWTTKGEDAEKLREKEEQVLRVLVRTWGPLLTMVFDRGYASAPWLEVLEGLRVRFIIRCIKKHIFSDQEGRAKKRWEIGRGKK
jgi:hypothetical protein